MGAASVNRTVSYGLIWRDVTSSNRAVGAHGMASRVAIALVLLHVTALAMVDRTIGGVAAGGVNWEPESDSASAGVLGRQRSANNAATARSFREMSFRVMRPRQSTDTTLMRLDTTAGRK